MACHLWTRVAAIRLLLSCSKTGLMSKRVGAVGPSLVVSSCMLEREETESHLVPDVGDSTVADLAIAVAI